MGEVMNTAVPTSGSRPAGPVTLDETRALWSAADPVSLGMLADEIRRRRHGDRVTYVRVARVDAASAVPVDLPAPAGEIRIVGCPASVDEAVALVRDTVRRAGGTPVTAFSLADVERLVGGAEGLPAVLHALADAGVSGVADVPLDELADRRRSLAALAGSGVRAMRFTAGQPAQDVPAWLHELRALQKATGVLSVFAPLPREADRAAPTTGYADVKLVALSRVVLDNVSSIQVDWGQYGPKLAQVALLFGADDLDGVSPVDDESEGRRRAPLEEVRRNIEAASLRPVERDGRFAVRE
jgi:hypothetical protein